MFRSYIDPEEGKRANRQLPHLMVEGLLMGGTGLGVLALIFEIAADAFSVAAYQTLLAIHGANGHHEIAIYAFIVLSVLLFLGIVPAYKAGAYLRPNAGGSGPLVEAIGPEKMRWLSWIGTSLFFIDAVLTIIISSISAADVTMLLLPEWAPYRILLAELFALFIMVVLVALGPKRAVPLFLIGGGAFTIFTIGALLLVGGAAASNPTWAFLTDGIVSRLELSGVAEHVVRAQQDVPALMTGAFFGLFFRSMSSAMLGFSGYEVIPASGKHAARPKWKVINTALTLAAVFLISTGVIQLFAASQWNIPATEGYSTLLIEYEIVAAQTLGRGVDEADAVVIQADRDNAQHLYEEATAHSGEAAEPIVESEAEYVARVSEELAIGRAVAEAAEGTAGATFLTVSGVLLAIILLLAQGGGYIGGSAVAANASRLGRLPRVFSDDRVGIAVIWGIAAVLIPIIREVVVVESYYAFGFVSAFIITSTTVYFVRDEALLDRGIDPASAEARSLRFAGLRGMIASYIMGIVLVTQKTDALLAIVIIGVLLTVYQLYVATGGFKVKRDAMMQVSVDPGNLPRSYTAGIERAQDMARQRGIADALEELLLTPGFLNQYNVGPDRLRTLIGHLYNIQPALMAAGHDDHHGHERVAEPNAQLEATYQAAYGSKTQIANDIERYARIGIFTFVHNYHRNWISAEVGRDAATVQQTMLDILFPMLGHEEIWGDYQQFAPASTPEAVWQFCRQRYLWAKDQWPNLSDRITTAWTLQDYGILDKNIDVRTVIAVQDGQQFKLVHIHPDEAGDQLVVEKETVD